MPRVRRPACTDPPTGVPRSRRAVGWADAMQTTTLRVSEPREILALVPHRLGFRPRDSAVAVSLRPPRGAVGLVVARRPAAPRATRPTGPLLARTLVAHLGRDGAAAAILVLYTDRDPRGEDGLPRSAAARHFREAAADALGDVLVWVVTADRLPVPRLRRRLLPAGRPAAAGPRLHAGGRHAGAGRLGRRGLARGHRPDPSASSGDVRRSVARVRRRWEHRCAEAVRRGRRRGEPVAGGLARGLAGRGRRIVEAGEPGPGGAPWGRIEAGLADRRVRDGVLVALVPGTSDLPERCVRDRAVDARARRGARRRDRR